ncbi:MAG TPA: hypothetical protein VLK58_10030 [Conexibacter sp.]|nr:hypothetical protein [Conexibacter sp.]
MPLAIASTVAVCLWIVLWSIGIGGFDGLLVSVLVVLIVGGIRALGSFIPNKRRIAGRSSSQGGW